MTVVSVSDSNNRLEDFEGSPSLTSIGGGGGPAQDNSWYFQGAYSAGRKDNNTSSTPFGFWVTTSSSVNMTTGDDTVWMAKLYDSDYTDLNATGLRVRLGGDQSNYLEYAIADDGSQGDIDVRVVGGVFITPIDPNVTAWRDWATGTPALTAVDEFAVTANFTNGNAKAPNVFTDAIDTGAGLFLTGGTSTDPRGSFENFLADDQGQVTSGRFGHWISFEGAVFCWGTHWVGRNNAGTPTAAGFSVSNVTVTFPGGRVDAGWNALKFDLSTAGSEDYDFDTFTLKGGGRKRYKVGFDTDNEVDGALDEITITAHDFATGEAVLYGKEGGSEAIGLTDATEYFVEVIDADTVCLHSYTLSGGLYGRQKALTAATPVSLTPSTSGNGETHTLTRQPDTRPDFYCTGTASDLIAANCVFQDVRTTTLTSSCALTNHTWVSPDSVVPTGATLSGCKFQGSTRWHGEYVMSGTVAQFEAFTNTDFTAGATGGHWWYITGTASDLDITGIGWSGGGNDPGDGNGMEFHTINDVDATNDEIDYATHGWATGDCVFYSKYDPSDGSLGTDSLNASLADGDMVFVRAVTAGSISLHRTKYGAVNNVDKIALAVGSSGEQHTLYSADADIVNATGGDITVNVSSGDSPSVRNVGAATTTVQNTVTLTITCKDADGAVAGARCCIFTGADPSGTQLMGEASNASGIAAESYNYGGAQPIFWRVAKKGYVTRTGTDSIGAGGFSVTVTLDPDTNVE